MSAIEDLKIEKDYISIIASGNSVSKITDLELQDIHSKSFVIGINYAPSRFYGKNVLDLLIFSDKKVSDWLHTFYADKEKDVLFLCRPNGVNPGNRSIKSRVDYWFNEKNKYPGNYTIVWLLQMIQQIFPKKKILLFGLDMTFKETNQSKWYDGFTSFDRDKRGRNYPTQKKLDQCGTQISQHVKKENIYNCNLNSGFNHFEKKDYKEILI